jgi:hypothetical protein
MLQNQLVRFFCLISNIVLESNNGTPGAILVATVAILIVARVQKKRTRGFNRAMLVVVGCYTKQMKVQP